MHCDTRDRRTAVGTAPSANKPVRTATSSERHFLFRTESADPESVNGGEGGGSSSTEHADKDPPHQRSKHTSERGIYIPKTET